MQINVDDLVTGLVQLVIGAAASWVWKLRKDVNAAHCKIRQLEEKQNGRCSQQDSCIDSVEATD